MSPDGDGCPAAPADTAGRTGWLDCGTTCPGRTAGGARVPETGTVVGTTRGWSWRYLRYSDDFGPGSASTRGHKSSQGHAGLRDGLKVQTAETCQRRSRTPRVLLIERAASSLTVEFPEGPVDLPVERRLRDLLLALGVDQLTDLGENLQTRAERRVSQAMVLEILDHAATTAGRVGTVVEFQAREPAAATRANTRRDVTPRNCTWLRQRRHIEV